MKRRIIIGFITAGIVLAAAGCKSQNTENGAAEAAAEPGIVLTVSMPSSEWSGYVKELSDLYRKEHPEIGSIEWNLVDRSMYSDLLRVSLASQKLPMPYRTMGSLEGTVYSVPLQIQGIGIAYNQKLLRAAGWERFPETKSEFEQLCLDLEEQDIKPMMNHYKETLLTMANNLFMLPAMAEDNPTAYMESLLEEDRQQEYEENWQALADYFDLTLRFGNRDSLTTGAPTARDYFFIEKYAMLNDEGSWLAPVLAKSKPALEQEISIGAIPIYEEAERNKLIVEVQALSVVKSSRHPKEAEEFLYWLATSTEASRYLRETMGCLPVMAMNDESLEGLSPLAAEVKESIKEGRTALDVVNCLPGELKNKSAELWGFYLTGDLSREEVLTDYQSLWKDYMKHN